MVLNLTPIYEACARLGYETRGDALEIEGWPVQFLPTRVMTPEHLMAIALQTGRAKDYARLIMFVEAGVADMNRLRDILARHSLLEAWTKFEKRFLQP